MAFFLECAKHIIRGQPAPLKSSTSRASSSLWNGRRTTTSRTPGSSSALRRGASYEFDGSLVGIDCPGHLVAIHGQVALVERGRFVRAGETVFVVTCGDGVLPPLPALCGDRRIEGPTTGSVAVMVSADDLRQNAEAGVLPVSRLLLKEEIR
jgi:hypothetical protein